MPAKRDINLYAGDDADLIFVLKDGAGNLIDLTGWASRMQIRESVAAEPPLLEKTGVIDGPAGKITISISGTESSDLMGGRKDQKKSVYDLETTDDGGKVQTLLCGRVFVKGDITR